jgi:hypothetical protein
LKKASLTIILFTILFTSANVNLPAQDFSNVHKLVTEGINAIYQIDFPAALSKFQEAKSQAPNDLRGPFFESTVYFWKAMFTKSRPDYETYLNLSDNLVKK